MGKQADSAAALGQVVKADLEPFRREFGGDPFRPFHQTDTVTAQDIKQAGFPRIVRAAQAVTVEVIDRRVTGVLMEQGVGGGGYLICAVGGSAVDQATDETGLAASQGTGQGDEIAGRKLGAQAGAQLFGLLRRTGFKHRHVGYTRRVRMMSIRDTMPSSLPFSRTGRAFTWWLLIRSAAALMEAPGAMEMTSR